MSSTGKWLWLALSIAACGEGGGGAGDIDGETDGGISDATVDAAPVGPDATDDAAPPDPDAAVAAIAVPAVEGCENLNPRHCMLPWPSDRWLAADAERETGYHLEYDPRALPRSRAGAPIDIEPYRRLDGYSRASQLLTMFDAPADLTRAATVDAIERSLEPDSPTVLLDLETGERIPHWVENDARAVAPEQTIFFLRPAARLEQNRAYGVAIRGLGPAGGAPFAPDAAFRALRDGVPSDSAEIEGRRAGFDRLFTKLGEAGVSRGELQQAWWFRTESFASGHDTMLAMRADALERLGDEGIGCTITSVEPDFGGVAFRRVRGTVTVPWYLDAPMQPAAIVRDGAGRPVFQRTEEVAFTAILPRSLAADGETGPLLQWGHGLFGEAEGTVSDGGLMRLAEEGGLVLAATDWAGMSQKDLPFLATALADVTRFYRIGEMLQQGMINQIALTRSLIGRCKDLPEMTSDGAPLIDPSRRWFLGGSQGSILGGAYLTLSPDIDRGALIVGGAGFSFMIERSIHYNTFEPLLIPTYPDRVDRALLMAFSQHTWDRAETANFLDYAEEGLPGVGPKRFLYLVAENDAQVPNLSSHQAARLAGIPAMQGSTHVPWGVEVQAPPYTGSAYIAMNTGDRPTPPGNVAPTADDGGHNTVGLKTEAVAMIGHFLLTGEMVVPCTGTCDLSGR